MVKRRLRSLKHNNDFSSSSTSVQDCPSRLLRAHKCITEAQVCLTETKKELDTIIDDNFQKKRSDLEIELKSILSFIPDCVHI